MQRQVGNDVKEVNVLNWMMRVALELIGQGGLGYSFDSLTHDVHNAYGDAIKQFMCVSVFHVLHALPHHIR